MHQGEKWRRQTIRKAMASGEIGDIPVEIFADSLSEPLRTLTGKIHPTLMGGEYLLDSLETEVEIVRIVLQSVTEDVISLRARWELGEIRYRLVDEYADQGSSFQITPESSSEPLALRELIQMLDTAAQDPDWREWPEQRGVTDCSRDINMEWGDAEEIRDFVTVSSKFYSELQAYDDERAEEWYEKKREEAEEGEE